MYVLTRNTDGAYFAQPNSEGPYTKSLERAQKFASKKQADISKGDYEAVVDISDEMTLPR